MIKIWVSVIFCVLVSASSSFAQSICGDGFYRIQLDKNATVYYELFSLTPKNESSPPKVAAKINRAFVLDESNPRESPNVIKIKNSVAEKFLKTYKAEKYQSAFYNLQLSGVSDKGLIKIGSAENYFFPLLLKLSSPDYKTAYFIGNILGGCRVIQTFDLEKK